MSRCFRLFCCLRWLRLTPSSPGSGPTRRVRDIDPGSRTASGFLFLVTVIFAALDVGRLHQSDSVPPSWQLAAIMVFAAALILQAAAMIVNPFFSPALRIQAERGHSVITRGPYRFLRHPGYLAMLIAMPASAVAIGSWLALIPAAGFGLVIVRRARKEDEFLKQNLSGYIDYMERVRGGLFPRRRNSRINMEEYWFVARLSDRSSDWKEVRFSVDSEDYESACVEAYRVAAEKGYRDVQDSPCTR